MELPIIKGLPIPVTERGSQPATTIKWPSMCLRLDWIDWIMQSAIIVSTARWKNIQIREKIVYTKKLSGFKRFRILSPHLRSQIQHLRRHEQTGEFLFRICPFLCKQQNQSGTKTFRIHRESGTISSSVNLV